MRSVVCWTVFVLSAVAFGSTVSSHADDVVDFARDVRPILASKCFACHGPDEDAREADLRLDTRNGATAVRDGSPAVVPGKPDESPLVERVESADEDERMPPPDSKLTLNDAEKRMLRRWVEQGAHYSKHWAFVPPKRPAFPDVADEDWIRNPIDRFVLARMKQAGLSPSPEADRYRLVRRVYLDLIGLPPTPEEVDAVVNDPRPDAYERLVDRLLASPHYGERWARPWLDLARYADTNGYEKDRPRTIWPYRDWVIDALNHDMPFDRFTIEQIAGDMLPHATIAQRIATGFHRNTMLNEEGGVEVEQFRYESLIDRVNTTGAVWLGLTVGCSQCHSHKFDPMTQTEYYRLLAFFNNADEPELAIPDADIARRRARLRAEIEQRERELATKWPAAEGTDPREEARRRQHAWETEQIRKTHDWHPLRPVLTDSRKGTTFTELDDRSLLAGGNRPNNDLYRIAFEVGTDHLTGLRLEALPHESLPAGGPGRAPISVGKIITEGDFLLSEFRAYLVPPGEALEARQLVRHSTENWKPLAIHRVTASHAWKDSTGDKTQDGNLDTGWRIGEETGKAHHLVFELAEPVAVPPGALLVVDLEQAYIHNMVLGRFRISGTSDRPPLASSGLPAEVESALRIPPKRRSPQQAWMVQRHFLRTAPELKDEVARIDALRATMPRFVRTLVMQERLPQVRRTTHRHHRGEYLKPKEVVTPGVPAFLHSFPKGAPRNRLGLARWLVDRRNPLVARVVVNRQWQVLFGRGIVKTSEDFGTQSSPPSHPKLLDWLAVEFMDRGWSLKQLHRLIVTSATYRQSSRVTPESLARDPENIWLSHAPRVRLEAEQVRDTILAAAGMLTERIGGPSVFPPQPEGVTSLSYGSLAWKTSSGADRFRRGIYTFLKRTAPYAMYGTFDAPTRETCVVRRGRSNTPLQALTLLNDVVIMEAAQGLAWQMVHRPATGDDASIRRLFRRILTRPARDTEVDLLRGFLKSQRGRLARGELDAAAICGVKRPAKTENSKGRREQDAELAAAVRDRLRHLGQAVPDKPVDAARLAEWAAWTTLVRALFNLDETITKE